MSRYSYAALLLTTVSLLGLSQGVVSRAMAGDADTTTTEVVVTAKRLEKTARSEQKAALNIINIQPAETIEKYPDFNAAEALGRVVGVSLSEDTGEGRFVEIRGIDGNLNGATFGGIVLLNTNPGGTYFGGGGRAVEMDTIPIGAVDRVEVIKSLRPDMDAEGLGGVVELTPRSAAGLTKPFFEGTVAGGYQSLRKSTAPLRAEFATGFRSGAFSAVFTGSVFNNRQAIDDVEADYIDPSIDKTFDDLQLRHYDYHRRRYGYGMELDYQPSPDHSFYLRVNAAGYVEYVAKRHQILNGLGDDTTTSGNVITAPSASLQLKTTDEQEAHRNQVIAAGGADRFGDLQVDYQLSHSRSSFTQDYNYGGTINSGTDYAIAYDNSGNGNVPTFTASGGNINDPAQYYLKKISNSAESDVDQETGAQVNFTLPANWMGNGEVKFGLRARLRDKTANNGSVSKSISGKPPLSQFNPGGLYTGFYDGGYTTGPFPDLHTLRSYAQTAFGTAPIALDNLFDDSEDIYAAYGQYSVKSGNWGFLGGVRVEQTQGTYRYNLTTTVNDVETTTRAVDKKTYTNFFPSAQLRYQFSDNLIARATWSTGIGRPGFNQLSTDSFVNTDLMTVEAGNPNLKPTTGNNFDATLEWYLPNSGILQVGLFDKQFKNYVATRDVPGPYQGETYDFISYFNIDNAYARGFEAAYNQRFTELPGLWSGLGVDANMTLVDSQAEIRKGEKSSLPGTSKATANLAVFYEKGGLSLRLASEYVGKTLFVAGGDHWSDNFQNARITADLYAGYDVNTNWKVYFKAKNLTNEKLRFYLGSNDFPIQREFYDQSYELGIKAKF